MSDEIAKAAEQAKNLGIYEIVRNIASNGKNTDKACDSTWEGCIVVFECQNGEPKSNLASASGIATHVRWFAAADLVFETRITMPDGTILYRALKKGQEVTDFRYGAWVDRIKTYSEQITLERQQAAEERAKKKQEAALKPFTKIDF